MWNSPLNSTPLSMVQIYHNSLLLSSEQTANVHEYQVIESTQARQSQPQLLVGCLPIQLLRASRKFMKIPGLGGPVVVANRSKANGGSDDPWRYNWNSHGCSSWRPTDQQFSRKKQPTTAINGCLPNLGETKWNVEKIVTFKEAIHICNWWNFSRLC